MALDTLASLDAMCSEESNDSEDEETDSDDVESDQENV